MKILKRYTLLYMVSATVLALLLSVTSCSRKDTSPLPRPLVQAERLMWDAPDSALHLLQSMPVPPKSQRLAHATWALLTAQARYRLFLPQSDSLINIAYDYFHRHGDARQKACTYNYRAGICKELHREEEAQRFYHLAAEEVKHTDDSRLGYLIYIGLSELYAYQDMGREALEMADKAEAYARECSDSSYICSAEIFKARACTVLDSLRMAARYYKASLRFANSPIDKSDVSNELAGIYRRLNRLDSAFYYMRKMMATHKRLGQTENAAENTVISSIYMAAHMPDSAIHYAEKILKDPEASLYQTAGAHQNLYLLYEEQKRYKEAADHCFKFCHSLDSIYRMNQSQILADVQAKYDYQNVIIENDKIKVRSLFLLSIVLCMAAISIYLFQKKFRQRERVLHQVQEEARNKGIQIQNNENQIAYLQDCITELNRRIETNGKELPELRDKLLLQIDQLEQTNQALRQELEVQCTCPPQTVIEGRQEMERLRKQYETLNACLIRQTPVLQALADGSIESLTPEKWKEIKAVMNQYYNQFAKKLEQTYQLSETDIEMCCLLKLRLPLARISSYLRIAPDSVKKKKGRLKKDLEKKLGGWGDHSSFDSWLLGL